MTGFGPRAQSGQRKPIGVDTMQRGQIGRSQREQRRRVETFGWKVHLTSKSSVVDTVLVQPACYVVVIDMSTVLLVIACAAAPG